MKLLLVLCLVAASNINGVKSKETITPTPDETVTIPTPDETVTIPTPNGTVTNPTPDETVTTPTPDETVTTPTPNGTATTPTPDETVTTPTPNGTATTPTPDETVTTPTPDETVTTPTPNGTATTPTPDETVTTPTPNGTVTTQTPNGTVTTPTPDETVTTPTPNGTATTPTPDETVTTPTPNGTVTTQTPNETVTTPTPPKDPCNPNLCGRGSTCTPSLSSFVCLCVSGDVYDEALQRCKTAKVIPLNMGLPGTNFDPGMSNQSSTIFQSTAKNITDSLDMIFNETDYISSRVLELTDLGTGTRMLSRQTGGVNAKIQMNFDESSSVNVSLIETTIKESPTGLLPNANITVRNLCEDQPCDIVSTSCNQSNLGSFTCHCKEGYQTSDFSQRVCVACPSGQGIRDDVCKPCGFGLTGFNCSDNWVLVLVILSSIFGGLLLITLIIFSIVACKSKKSSKTNRETDFGKPYVSHSAARSPLVQDSGRSSLEEEPTKTHEIFTNGVIKIPRAKPTASWDSRTRIEMAPGNSRQNLVDVGKYSRHGDMDDNGGQHRRSRHQANPYAQNRPQFNPYAQSNPSYVHDDGRRNY